MCVYSFAHSVRGGEEPLQSEAQEVITAFRSYHGKLSHGHVLRVRHWTWMQVRIFHQTGLNFLFSLFFQPNYINFFLIAFYFFVACWFSHSLMCQATAWKPALGFSESVRAQSCTSVLCNGADQPSPTQIHERRHGPAVTGQCEETSGYKRSDDFILSKCFLNML